MSRYNLDQFEQMSTLVSELKAVLWSVFFLVPTGRANDDMQISAFEAENILRKMSTLSEYSSFDVKATACPQFRRILIEEGSAMETFNSTIDVNADRKLGQLRSYQSVNDGRGLLFISDVGEIYPSGFLPISCGNVREVSLSSVYREHEIFKQLRNPELLEGKCGRCDYKYICGGSRARAYARYGNYLAQDDLCLYSQP
jgi:radical SAM protein with 4Fe4S-binding SPASM domain